MQSAPVDFYTQQLFEPHVGQMNVVPETIQKRELARLVGRLERDYPEPKSFGETICEGAI